jgi:hypothetical protein
MSSYAGCQSWREAVNEQATHVETVELGNAILSNELGDARVALGHPSEELGNTHDGCCCL